MHLQTESSKSELLLQRTVKGVMIQYMYKPNYLQVQAI
jgi:hypothetical protein